MQGGRSQCPCKYFKLNPVPVVLPAIYNGIVTLKLESDLQRISYRSCPPDDPDLWNQTLEMDEFVKAAGDMEPDTPSADVGIKQILSSDAALRQPLSNVPNNRPTLGRSDVQTRQCQLRKDPHVTPQGKLVVQKYLS